jgi:tripartite-type tricarboxylate transporter receptor subunit TctC
MIERPVCNAVIKGTWQYAAVAVFMWSACISRLAEAAEYPLRPIRFIVPFAARGGPDLTARLLATDLSKQMGQQFVIDNRAGAAGRVG